MLETDSATDVPLRYPTDRPARLTNRPLDFAPGASTGLQWHDAPVFAYLPAGVLEFEYADDRLRAAMEAEDFRVYPNEWWHHDYQGWGPIRC